MTMKIKRVVLGTGILGIARSYGETKGGYTIPTAYGIWDEKKSCWKKLTGIHTSGKRGRLVAEVI